MNVHPAKQFEEMITLGQSVRVPDNFRALAEDGLSKSREAFGKFLVATRLGADTFGTLANAAQRDLQALNEQLLKNAATNVEVMFDAAAAMARSKTLPELTKLHAEFFQQQMLTAGEQLKDLLEISTKTMERSRRDMLAAMVKVFEEPLPAA